MRLLFHASAVAVLMSVVSASNGPAVEPADLVLRGGIVRTMDREHPEAEAVAVREGRIVWVGSSGKAASWIGPGTQVVELRGRTVLPGFIESHGHFVALGRSLMTVDLTGASTYEEVVQRVARATQHTPKGQWIVGRGWHQEKWTRRPTPNVEGYPTHHALSRVTPDHPVLLTHATGHMSLANTLAMKLAGVDARTPDPAGGQILRDETGEPTGVFRENAMGLVEAAYNRAQARIPAPQRKAQTLEAIRLAAAQCLEHGVTTFHDAGTDFETVDLYRELAEAGKLPVRLYVMLNVSNSQLARHMADYRCVGVGDGFLTVRAVKRLADGALGSHGAWMLEPYDDLPSSTGQQTVSRRSLEETARLCLQHNYQLCVHAIGDRANREVLDVFEEAFRNVPDGRALRWRIEHAQHLAPSDIPRFAKLGIIASMQACHATSDGPFVVTRLGVRRAREGAYAWRRLLDAGARIANGTDVPVEPIDPFACLYASVTRRLPNGIAFFPEQCMTRQEALESYTVNGAFAAFEEQEKGTIAEGRRADLIVLSGDPLRCPDDELPKLRVETTIVAGRIVYQRS